MVRQVQLAPEEGRLVLLARLALKARLAPVLAQQVQLVLLAFKAQAVELQVQEEMLSSGKTIRM
jgi:hypothetical protein